MSVVSANEADVPAQKGWERSLTELLLYFIHFPYFALKRPFISIQPTNKNLLWVSPQ